MLEGTPQPGEAGNVGIAGHSDGFFRVLKDIVAGDLMELALPGETRRYRTLVTSYPFLLRGARSRAVHRPL